MTLTTSDLKTGFRVRLKNFGLTDTAYRQKLLSFGLTRGTEVEVIRIAPLGCPVQLEVRGTAVALRFEEASCLEWERLSCA